MEPTEPLGPPELPKKEAKKFTPLTTVQPHVPETDADESDSLNEHVENPGDPDGVVAAEEWQKWQNQKAQQQAAASMEPQQRKRRRWPWVFLVLVVLAAAAAGAYWYGTNKSKSNKSDSGLKSTNSTAATKPQISKKESTVPTKHYDSTTYTLGLDYPQDWKLTDNTTKLTIASPTMPLVSADGNKIDGHVVVSIQNPQTSIPGYPTNGAMAVIESQKLSYKQPTNVQRAQTYLTYLGYTKTSGLDALYITGDNGYQLGQVVPMSDVIKGNPLTSVTFESCTSDDCATGTPTPITIRADSWPDSTVSKQIEALLESLAIN